MDTISISIRKVDDFHVHFRQGDVMGAYVRRSALWCERVLVMPNTIPSIRTASDALMYKKEILSSLDGEFDEADGMQNFTPLMTCKLYADHSPSDIVEMRQAGIVACKLLSLIHI